MLKLLTAESGNNMSDKLTLKWGTIKSWSFKDNTKAMSLLEEYFKIGSSASAMCQQDTDRQKEIICELIDVGNFDTVYLDWSGEYLDKEKAKDYVLNYRASK